MSKSKWLLSIVLILFAATVSVALFHKPVIKSTSKPFYKAVQQTTVATITVKPKQQQWIPSTGNSPFPANGIPILYYHSIAYLKDNVLGVPPQQFAAQMQYLHDAGYTTISMQQLSDAMQKKTKLPPKPVLITFDDGYDNNYSVAFPILKKYNFTATFFVITSYMNGKGMMSWPELKEMQDYGMTIAPHTVNHINLATVSLPRQLEEIRQSTVDIKARLGSDPKVFCYPFGGYNQATLTILHQFGYQLAVTTVPGKVYQSSNPLLLHRVFVSGFKNLTEFEQRL